MEKQIRKFKIIISGVTSIFRSDNLNIMKIKKLLREVVSFSLRQLLNCFLLIFLILMIHSTISELRAQDTTTKPFNSRVLNVVVKPTVPFVFRDSGELKGYSMDLLNLLSKECGFTYTVYEVPTMATLIDEVSQGKYDIGVGAISITQEREKVIDFTHPFFESGLQVMVLGTGETGIWSTIKKVFTGELLGFALILFGLILLISHILWFVERKLNSESFPMNYKAGIGESIWWSLSTLISGGCENKAPIGFAGRLVAFIWMLGAIGLTSFITASLASAMTVNTLSSDINGLSDLKGSSIATITGSSAENFLKKSGYLAVGEKKIEEAVQLLEKRKVKGVVFDSPMLNYYVVTHPGSDLQVVGSVFENQNYGFALPLRSDLRKSINEGLLKLQFSGALEDLKDKWFSVQ